MTIPSNQPGPRRTLWRAVAFLTGSTIVLVLAIFGYLIPALRAAATTTQPAARRQLAADSVLVLVVVLFAILALLVLSFGIGRLLLPKAREDHGRTDYPDAWSESARRLKLPNDEDPSSN